MDDLNDKTVLILGLGASGLAMARWCAGRGARVRVWDSRPNPPQAAALGELPGAGFFSGELAAAAAEGVACIFKSPGLSPNDARLAALLAEARRAGVPVRGELDLFSEALAQLKTERGYAPKVLAITGTNGKTTTTSLTGQLVARAGRRVAVAGNIGPTMLDTLAAAIREQDEADRIAAEEAAAKAATEAEEAAARAALEAAEAQAVAAAKAKAEADKPAAAPAKKAKAAKAAAADEASVAIDAPALDPLADDAALGNEAADPAAIRAESVESAQADAQANAPVALAAGDDRPLVDDETSVIAAIDEPPALVDAGTDAELAGEDDELIVDAEELRQLAALDGTTVLDAQAEADADAGEAADAPASDASPIEPAAEAAPAAALPDDDAPTIVLVPPPPAEPVFSHLPQVWVLELSSFQLDDVQDFVPSAATVLNVTQDHLDWHGDMPAYAAAKARVFGTGAMPATVMVVNRDEPAVEAMVPPPVVVKPTQRGQRSRTIARRVVRFGLDAPRAPGDFGLVTENGMAWLVRAMESDPTIKRKPGDVDEIVIQRLMPADALRIRGRHNASNALAALALASAVGVPLAPMLHGLREYRGEPHRVETIGVVDGIEFIDDSKGTNVGATVAALDGLGADRAPGKLAVILGGDGKGQDFAPLAEPLRRHARAAATIGKDAAALEAVLQSAGVHFERHATLEAATRWALAQAQPGDAVLLSPACASLDMFRDYAHRAQVFAQAMNAIAEDGTSPAASNPGGWP